VNKEFPEIWIREDIESGGKPAAGACAGDFNCSGVGREHERKSRKIN